MNKRWLVRGRVQGVGYRWFLLRQAERVGIRGFARNLPDGNVEVVGQGSVAALAEFAQALVAGPPGASVEAVEETDNLDEMVYRNFFVL